MIDKNSIRKFSSHDDGNRDDMFQELQECADILVEKLQRDDISGVVDVVQAMVEARDRSLFKEVGKLTRGLHDALVDFHIDSDVSDKDANGVPFSIDDASHRLDYVIGLMQDAANKTMDRIDEISPIAGQFSNEAKVIRDEWARLRRKEMKPEEFRELYSRIDGFLETAVESSNQLNSHLQKIMLTQSYQDLSGQIIRRVIGMVKDVERNLVDLVKRSGQVERMVGIVASKGDIISDTKPSNKTVEEGPQVRKRDHVMSKQDDVDDLLSSLGF